MHRSLRCPFALHKLQIYSAAMTDEMADFEHNPSRSQTTSFFTLNTAD